MSAKHHNVCFLQGRALKPKTFFLLFFKIQILMFQLCTQGGFCTFLIYQIQSKTKKYMTVDTAVN